MVEFASVHSFARFEKSVYSEARFVHSRETREFLRAVMETSESRTIEILKGHRLWRAQLGSTPRQELAGTDASFDVPGAHQPERMTPKAEFVADGRVNPRGIPCLYLATDENTALAEMRPWVGAYVSVAEFEVLRNSRVIDCSRDKRRPFRFTLGAVKSNVSAPEKENEVWGEIGYAFSKPVTPKEPVADYIPTQILAEAFRAHGLDGLVYKSELGGGHNVALFDITAAKLKECVLRQAAAIQYTFKLADNPYFIEEE